MSDEEEYDFLIPSKSKVDPKENGKADFVGDIILRDWDALSKRNLVNPPSNKDRSWVRSRTKRREMTNNS